VAGTTQHLSDILLGSDYVISVPVLKDHNFSGVTFSMKNFYGCIDSPSSLHGGYCDPGIPALYSRDEIRLKCKLIIGEALLLAYKDGPATAPQFRANSIFIGTDPVAMDCYGLAVINHQRTVKGLGLISTDVDNGHVPATYLKTAANAPYSLGLSTYRLTTITL
jgi:uncharacterized protein (DUF362 family)